jgi:Spy/CpxP family protein refolding chaperone
MRVRKLLLCSYVFLLFPVIPARAQETIDPAKPAAVVRDRRIQRQERRQQIRKRRLLRMREQLGLSDLQRQQLSELRQSHLESIKPLRKELFALREKLGAGSFTDADRARVQLLRRELREERKNLRSDIHTIFTPEQRLRIEELRKARQERRERSEN